MSGERSEAEEGGEFDASEYVRRATNAIIEMSTVTQRLAASVERLERRLESQERDRLAAALERFEALLSRIETMLEHHGATV